MPIVFLLCLMCATRGFSTIREQAALNLSERTHMNKTTPFPSSCHTRRKPPTRKLARTPRNMLWLSGYTLLPSHGNFRG